MGLEKKVRPRRAKTKTEMLRPSRRRSSRRPTPPGGSCRSPRAWPNGQARGSTRRDKERRAASRGYTEHARMHGAREDTRNTRGYTEHARMHASIYHATCPSGRPVCPARVCNPEGAFRMNSKHQCRGLFSKESSGHKADRSPCENHPGATGVLNA